jgi:thiol-disulfide isomerase/thioredoxin
MGNTTYTEMQSNTEGDRRPYRYRPVEARPARQAPVDDEYEVDEERTGLFSTPGRAMALGGAAVVLLAVMSVAVWLLSTQPHNPQVQLPTTEAPVVGSLAPKFSLFDVHSNQQLDLTALKGKPVFLNFWGTWCPPCKAEMPEIQRIYNAHKNDIAVIGVSMGPRDEPAGVKNFVDAANYSWMFIHDTNYDVATRYNVVSIPSSFFIDKNGVVRVVHVGMMDGNMMENYIQRAEQQ